MSEPVRIGVVGFGAFGRLHAQTLAGLAEAELVAIVDRNDAARDAGAKAFPRVRCWSDLQAAARESGVRAWVVATRTESHVPIAAELLRAGHCVLVEKPLATDAVAARTLAPLVARDSANFMAGHILLFSPEFQRIVHEIKTRGPLRYFHAFRHRSTDHSVLYPEETPLRLLMVHDLYMAMVMTGGEEPSRLAARLRPRPEGGHDLALAEVEWPSGAWGSFTASFLTPPGMAREGFDRLELFGKDWSMRVQMNPGPVEVYDDRAHWPASLAIYTDPPSGWLAEELRWFCRVARGEVSPPTGARYEDALRVQDVAGQARSIREKLLVAAAVSVRLCSGHKKERRDGRYYIYIEETQVLDPARRSHDFPTLAGMHYLNTAAEGIPPLVVGEAFAQYFADHQLGMDGREKHMAQLEAAKALAAEFYGLSPGEIAICSCSSEAYNLAAAALQLREGDEVVINDLDFPAGATPWLQPSCPARVKLWKSREGALRLEDLPPLLSPKTRLVTVSLVSFFNGFRLDIPATVEAVRKHSRALLAVDVTQALGRIPLDLAGVDLIVSSTHKWILATHGGGIVGVPARRAADLTTQAGGWFHLDDAFGADRFERVHPKPGAASFAVGMPNFPAIYAIRAALEYLRGVGVAAIDRAARPLVEHTLGELARLPIELLTPRDPTAIAGILAFRHPKAELLHHHLRAHNVHVMSHAGRLRVAIHGYNTEADIAALMRRLNEALAKV